jgi:hypothetical protein
MISKDHGSLWEIIIARIESGEIEAGVNHGIPIVKVHHDLAVLSVVAY